MKHQFYQNAGQDSGLSPGQIAALETVQDHARQIFAGDVATFAPPLPEDPETAELCLREWHAVLDDLSCAAMTTPAAGITDISHQPESAPRLAFRMIAGALDLADDYPWRARQSPVLRSAVKAAASAVLYSDIIALEASYALVELRASDEELRLNISGGGKNQSKIYISLYTNGSLVEKSLLGTEVSWDLSSSEPGIYQLEFGATPALSFQIQE